MKQFSINLKVIILTLSLAIGFTACGGGGGESTPGTEQILGKTWTISSVNGATTEVATFILQTFTISADGNTVSATYYPSGAPTSASWVSSGNSGTLTLDGTGITISDIVISGNTLSGTVNIPADFNGKTAGFNGSVEYTSN